MKQVICVVMMLIVWNSYSNFIFIPMDFESQDNHLKAYGISYWLLEKDQKVQWLLNYKGGSFLTPYSDELKRECTIRGVSFEVISDKRSEEILQLINSPSQNMEAVLLEKAPKIAVYSPNGNAPWDDAVTMVLEFAEIPYETIYDKEVLQDELLLYDWLHLHHEDFTGQYGKFYRAYRSAPWYIQEKKEAESLAKRLGYDKVSDAKLAVAKLWYELDVSATPHTYQKRRCAYRSAILVRTVNMSHATMPLW